MVGLRRVPQSVQGVPGVIQSLSLFDTVSGCVKQPRALSASAFSAWAMRSGSLVLSTSKSAALYKFLHALMSRDLELPVFIIPPLCRFASESESCLELRPLSNNWEQHSRRFTKVCKK